MRGASEDSVWSAVNDLQFLVTGGVIQGSTSPKTDVADLECTEGNWWYVISHHIEVVLVYDGHSFPLCIYQVSVMLS